MTSQEQSSGRKRGRGQPTKFREEYVEQVRALCEAGVRDEEIAAYLGVSSRSLHRWQERFPQFFEARELKHDRKSPNRPRRSRPELCERARKLCILGFTNMQVAQLMGFHLSTFDRWRHEIPRIRRRRDGRASSGTTGTVIEEGRLACHRAVRDRCRAVRWRARPSK
jgi:transposase-like protein